MPFGIENICHTQHGLHGKIMLPVTCIDTGVVLIMHNTFEPCGSLLAIDPKRMCNMQDSCSDSSLQRGEDGMFTSSSVMSKRCQVSQ